MALTPSLVSWLCQLSCSSTIQSLCPNLIKPPLSLWMIMRSSSLPWPVLKPRDYWKLQNQIFPDLCPQLRKLSRITCCTWPGSSHWCARFFTSASRLSASGWLNQFRDEYYKTLLATTYSAVPYYSNYLQRHLSPQIMHRNIAKIW